MPRRRSRLVTACLIAGACAAGNAEEAYRWFDVALPEAGPGGRLMVCAIGDRVDRVVLLPGARALAIRMRASAERVDGEVDIGWPGKPDDRSTRSRAALRVELAAENGVVRGRVAGPIAGKQVDARVTGALRSEADLARDNALAAGTGWPCWTGPSQSFVADDTPAELVEDLGQARLVWRSEFVSIAEMGSTRYGLCVGSMPCAGSASPIVADGRLFQFHYRPTGPVMAHVEQQLAGPGGAKAQEQMAAIGWTRSDLDDLWRISADELVLCADAASGRTLWRAEFPDEGANLFDHKGCMTNNTPCAVGGRVFVIGVLGIVRALDAKDGRLLWRAELPGWYQDMSARKMQWIKHRGVAAPGRSFCRGLNWAGDVVLAPDSHSGDCGIVAYDQSSGALRWHVKGCLGSYMTPLRWTNAGREFVVAANSTGQITCIDAKSGDVTWTVTDAGTNRFQPVLAGDRLVVSITRQAQDAKSVQRMGCYELGPRAAKRIWELPEAHPLPGAKALGMAWRGRLYARCGDPGRLVVVDLANGTVVDASAPNPGGNGEAHAFIHNSRLWMEPTSQHGHTDGYWFAIGDGPPRPLGGLWDPPHLETVAYQVPISHPVVDGRMYMRGQDGIYCYDLRRR